MALLATYRNGGTARNLSIVSPRFCNSPPVCVVCCLCSAARALSSLLRLHTGMIRWYGTSNALGCPIQQYLEYQSSRCDFMILFSIAPIGVTATPVCIAQGRARVPVKAAVVARIGDFIQYCIARRFYRTGGCVKIPEPTD